MSKEESSHEFIERTRPSSATRRHSNTTICRMAIPSILILSRMDKSATTATFVCRQSGRLPVSDSSISNWISYGTRQVNGRSLTRMNFWKISGRIIIRMRSSKGQSRCCAVCRTKSNNRTFRLTDFWKSGCSE